MTTQTSTANLLPIVPFAPVRTQVINITRANPGVVTTTQPHGLVSGQEVRINVPRPCVMTQINGKQFVIVVIDATSFFLYSTLTPYPEPFSTINYSAFLNTADNLQAEVVPMGSAPISTVFPDLNVPTGGYFKTQLYDQTLNQGEHP